MKTTNMSKPIRSIQALNSAIRALRDKQKTLEGKMDESMMNLKGNYFNMTLNSVFGEKNHRPISGQAFSPVSWKVRKCNRALATWSKNWLRNWGTL